MNIVLGQRYEFVKPVLAISELGSKQSLVHLQAGVVVKVDGYSDGSRMVKVVHRGRALLMFAQDLQDRAVCLAEIVSAPKAVSIL